MGLDLRPCGRSDGRRRAGGERAGKVKKIGKGRECLAFFIGAGGNLRWWKLPGFYIFIDFSGFRPVAYLGRLPLADLLFA